MVKLMVIGPPSGSFSSVSIYASSSQVLNFQFLWVVSLCENSLPRKFTFPSNSPFMPYLSFEKIILLICMISWSQLIVPGGYLNFCPADTECSRSSYSRWGNFSSINSTGLSKVNQLSLKYLTLLS